MPAIPVTTLGAPKVVSSKPLENEDSKFVELSELTYVAANGTEVGFAIAATLAKNQIDRLSTPQRRWEAVNRKTRSPDVEADAVDIFAHIMHPTKGSHTIIALQYRVSGAALPAKYE